MAVHNRHLYICDNTVNILLQCPLFLVFHQFIPCLLTVHVHIQIRVAGFLQTIRDQLAQKRRILRQNNRRIASLALAPILDITQPKSGIRADIRHDLLKIENDYQLIIQLNHAG